MASRSDRKSRYRFEEGVPCIDIGAKSIDRLLDIRDPAPFRERDLDPGLVEYLAGAADDVAALGRPKARVIFWLAEPCPTAEIAQAFHAQFTDNLDRIARRNDARRRMGLTALTIAVLLLAALLPLGEIARTMLHGRVGDIVAEGGVILSWIVLWRPLEVLLYEWIPFRRERKLVQLLLAADVEVRSGPPPFAAPAATPRA